MPDTTDEFNHIRCPRCGRGIFDIAKSSEDEAIIRVKCPQCKLIIVYSIKNQECTPQSIHP